MPGVADFDSARLIVLGGNLVKYFISILIAVTVAGCAMGEGARWAGSQSEIVQVEGIPYQVQYVRSGDGYDMRSLRVEPIVIMPDQMIEQRRSASASLMVGQKLCPGATVESSQKGADMLTMVRVRCS
jgi:hypothetical protein